VAFNNCRSVAVGPPLGGTLYTHFGFRGPFIFSLAATFLDLIGRVIIIERKHAIQWGYDPAAVPVNRGNRDSDAKRSTLPLDTTTKSEIGKGEEVAISPPSNRPVDGEKKLSLSAVISKLSKSHRALTALIIIFTYG
jgi:DHA1 family solute carrier family 18 vesicular amine transporter 1/2